MKLTATEYATLQVVASSLGVNSNDLYNLIDFESGWNPKAKNTFSSARGLIQFVDSTAQKLGFKDSADLVKKNPTTIDQLSIVKRYLQQFAPFGSQQSLYMSVFYPSARTWSTSTVFPDSVRNVNPGITTVSDYMKKVNGGKKNDAIIFIVGGIAILYILLKERIFK